MMQTAVAHGLTHLAITDHDRIDVALTARDAAAGTPLSALDLTGTPAFLTPPSLPEPRLKWGSW